MPKIYGAAPVDLGLVDLSPTEMMFWLYCPIKLPDQTIFTMPDNLEQFWPLVSAALRDFGMGELHKKYFYLTAKTVWATHENPGNRRGWHSDGYMTDDVNYIWSSSNGTLFWEPKELVDFTQDHTLALAEMDEICERGPVRQYPDKHLLRLDQSVMHRVADFAAPGVRTFVKISISDHAYNLLGNSINHRLQTDWVYGARSAVRNTETSPT